MKTHEFSIIASGLDPEAKDFESRFFDAGCDDATVSFQKGHIIVDFAREANSLDEAIASAVSDVSKTGAKVDRVEPDPLVSLAEIASRIGTTRAAISNYAKGERREHFPPPAARVTSNSPLWEWATVAKWMYRNKKVEKQTALDAEIVRKANVAIDDGEFHLDEILKKVAVDYGAELEKEAA